MSNKHTEVEVEETFTMYDMRVSMGVRHRLGAGCVIRS